MNTNIPEGVFAAIREARAALLNPNLTESERAVVVRMLEGVILSFGS